LVFEAKFKRSWNLARFMNRAKAILLKQRKSFGWAADYLSLLAFSCGEQIPNQTVNKDSTS
jgi:hypothetical protein